MSRTSAIDVRRAKTRDAEAITAVHDAAWRYAYDGMIPAKELGRIIARRGPQWWHRAIGRGTGIISLESGRTSPNSSESVRQPRCDRPAHKVVFPSPGAAGRINALPFRSRTAACSIKKQWDRSAMTRFTPHSRTGNACSSGMSSCGTRPSTLNRTTLRYKRGKAFLILRLA